MSRTSWTSFTGDYAFGTKQEDLIHPKLETHFGRKLTKNPNKYAVIDYSDEEGRMLIELKSRRNAYARYATTLLTSHKIKKLEGQTKEVWFVFNFTDGLYSLKYDPEVFATFELAPFQRWNRQDRQEKEVEHYYIPIEALSPILV